MRTDDDNAEDAVCKIAGRNNAHGAKLKHAKIPKAAEIVRETAVTRRKYHRSFPFNTVSMPSEKPIVAPPMDLYVGIRDPQFAALPRNIVHFHRQRLYIGPWLHPSLRRFPQRRIWKRSGCSSDSEWYGPLSSFERGRVVRLIVSDMDLSRPLKEVGLFGW